MRVKLFSLLIACLCMQWATSQTTSISGKVTDPDGLPIPGVSVQVKGTNKGTYTNEVGSFSLVKSENDKILEFTITGFTTKEVVIGMQTTINVSLEVNYSNLDDVIVVGYGSQKRSDVSGSVVSVSGEQMNQFPTTSVGDMLRGKVPGLLATANTNRPGGTANILIRGTRSLSGSNSPLFVVDNVPVRNIDDLNSADIESVEVLKDASSQAIYGARAANGVILITTKRGTINRVTVDYNGYLGVQQLNRNFEFYDGESWADFRREAFRTENQNDEYEPDEVVFDPVMLDVLQRGAGVDWEDFMLSNALQQKHDVSLRGGNDKTRFAGTFGYFNQEGMAQGSGFERGNLRFNIDQKITDKINMGANFAYSRYFQTAEDGEFNSYITTVPLGNPYDADGNQQLFINAEGELNPKFLNEQTLDERRVQRLLLNVFLNVDLLPGLRYRNNSSINTRNNDETAYRTSLYARGSNQGNRATIASSQSYDFLIENILTYDKEINRKHKFDLTAMQSFYEEVNKSFSQTGSDLPNDFLGYNGIGTARLLSAPSRGYNDRNLISYMGRLRYSFNDRYLFTFTTRVDGSSVFGPANKYGMFPSASVAWKMEQEDFIKNIPWVNQLKLRVNYGEVGNQAVEPYTTLGLVSDYQMLFGDGSQETGYLTTNELSNPNLKWETTLGLNVGVDYDFFNGRISGSLEYYKTNTRDLLIRRSINPALGYSNMLDNLGEVQNRGFEFMLNTVPVRKKDFTWLVNMNFSTNKNKLLRINGEVDEDGNPVNDLANNWFIGEPIAVYYDYIFDGIWQTKDDPANSYMPDADPGDIRIKDLNNDGVIDANNDRDLIYRDPKWFGTLGTSVNFKGLELMLDFYTVQGGFRRNPYLYDFNQGGSVSGKTNGLKRDYWTPENPSNTTPRPRYNGSILFFSSLGYQDASYIRLRTTTLAYTLPNKIVQKIGINRLRVYATGSNLWTKTEFLSYSPEITPGGYPEPQTLIFGLNVSF